MKPIVLKRTFEAARHPKGSAERERLNRDVRTSEYMPSMRWIVRRPCLMSDGSPHPRQPWVNDEFRTKREAEAFAAEQPEFTPFGTMPD